MSRRAAWLAAAGWTAACIVAGAPDEGPRLRAAVADLARAGFEFEADVRFRSDPMAGCDGFACADLLVIRERRTIVVARDAFESEARLRASLLEVWERYRTPRPGSQRDAAAGALRVLRDGARVGVDDPALLRRVHRAYSQHWTTLEPEQRAGLPAPDEIAYP